MAAEIRDALFLILRGDRDVWLVTAVSLQVSMAALILAAAVAVPVAYATSQARRSIAAAVASTAHVLAALPTVVVGLTLYFVLSASGPLGWTHLLYTRAAMTAGQCVLALPIILTIVLVSLQRLPVEAHETARTLGLAPLVRMRILLGEVRGGIIAALLLAFARVFTELGAALILGGNIRGATRTLTTVIALEHNRGDDARAIALGVILLIVALAVNGVTHWLGRRGAPEIR